MEEFFVVNKLLDVLFGGICVCIIYIDNVFRLINLLLGEGYVYILN